MCGRLTATFEFRAISRRLSSHFTPSGQYELKPDKVRLSPTFGGVLFQGNAIETTEYPGHTTCSFTPVKVPINFN